MKLENVIQATFRSSIIFLMYSTIYVENILSKSHLVNKNIINGVENSFITLELILSPGKIRMALDKNIIWYNLYLRITNFIVTIR